MKKSIHHLLPLALLLAISPLSNAKASLFATESDDRIETSAQKSYVFKTYLKKDAITVHSKDGAVTLSGTVLESSHIQLAQDTVEAMTGVRSVDNKLKLKGEALAENSDAWITVQITSGLLFHRNVRALDTGVKVRNGVVTLTGEASSMAQKELTTAYAQDVNGVKLVNNEMTVNGTPAISAKNSETLGEKIDDASITAQVKMALISHRSTSVVKTKVQTTEGVVTLSGIAKNEAEKALVSKLVNDIDGVTQVINDMTVGGTAASRN
jgi:osmotically-inducible protein OsmY